MAGLDWTTTALHMHYTFLYISLPSLHDYDVKMPNFTFCEGHEHKTIIFFSWLEQYKQRVQTFRINNIHFCWAGLSN